MSGSSSNHCRNCGTFLGEPTGNFCPNCGQDTLNHPPSFWEFIHEFITHYVALEGKLWKTLLLLFFKPAQLTREYREGRKQRYISPLRLYITASFLFFLFFKFWDFGSIVTVDADGTAVENSVFKISHSAPKPDTPMVQFQFGDAKKDVAQPVVVDGKGAPAATTPVDSDEAAAKALDAAIDGWKKNSSFNLGCERWQTPTSCAWLEKRLKKKYEGKNDEQMWATVKVGLASNVPYAIFLALPFFAMFTKLLYIRRGYYFGEHFVYALHIHAFTFFVMLLILLVGTPLAFSISVILAALYYFIGLHRFFGGRWWMNVLRYLVLAFLYPSFLCIVAAVLLLVVFIG
jgi:hypothetical protein